MKGEKNFIDRILCSLEEIAQQKIISKGELILAEGQIEKNLYFVETGAVRVFLLTELEEQTIRFGYKGSFINSLSSFIKETPSEFYIEAIRKSSIKIISKSNLLKLVNEDMTSLQQYISLLELLITQQIEREVDLLTVSPSDRLKRVLQRSPNLFQEIPLKYIASYLRMTPETLSRIRNS
ncbi:MAG: Crp/Fnr family transcriptional regulator [Chitinophagaceae bacterium]